MEVLERAQTDRTSKKRTLQKTGFILQKIVLEDCLETRMARMHRGDFAIQGFLHAAVVLLLVAALSLGCYFVFYITGSTRLEWILF